MLERLTRSRLKSTDAPKAGGASANGEPPLAYLVIPAKAGIHKWERELEKMDSRFRGSDKNIARIARNTGKDARDSCRFGRLRSVFEMTISARNGGCSTKSSSYYL